MAQKPWQIESYESYSSAVRGERNAEYEECPPLAAPPPLNDSDLNKPLRLSLKTLLS